MARLNDFSYAAHAGSNTFLLDDDGICRKILSRGKGRTSTNKSTQRCLGAQYVASLDFASESGLVERPKEGCPLLFARVDEAGRVSLVRTAPLERFEEIKREGDPVTDEHPAFNAPDPDDLPPRTIRAEAIAPQTHREPKVDSLRLAKTIPGLPDVVRSTMKVDIDYLDPLDRTQQRAALDPRRLPDLHDDDPLGDDATIVAERPPELKRRGMLPRERPSESLAKHEPPPRSDGRPPPSGRRSGR